MNRTEETKPKDWTMKGQEKQTSKEQVKKATSRRKQQAKEKNQRKKEMSEEEKQQNKQAK